MGSKMDFKVSAGLLDMVSHVCIPVAREPKAEGFEFEASLDCVCIGIF